VLSSDGRFIAYVSDALGRDEVFVHPFPEVQRGQWRVSLSGGTNPRWRGDGRELFYIDPDGVLMAVDVQAAGEAFEWREPRALFPTGIDSLRDAGFSYVEVTADGERFLLGETEPATGHGARTAGVPIHAIVNWTAGLASQ
jgi:hypothetical protein